MLNEGPFLSGSSRTIPPHPPFPFSADILWNPKQSGRGPHLGFLLEEDSVPPLLWQPTAVLPIYPFIYGWPQLRKCTHGEKKIYFSIFRTVYFPCMCNISDQVFPPFSKLRCSSVCAPQPQTFLTFLSFHVAICFLKTVFQWKAVPHIEVFWLWLVSQSSSCWPVAHSLQPSRRKAASLKRKKTTTHFRVQAHCHLPKQFGFQFSTIQGRRWPTLLLTMLPRDLHFLCKYGQVQATGYYAEDMNQDRWSHQ